VSASLTPPVSGLVRIPRATVLVVEGHRNLMLCTPVFGPAHMTQDIYGKKFFPTPLNQCRGLSRT
jgi:hypothetical protein